MKYVKIYDEKMTPCGIIDIESDMSAYNGKYVKVLGANMQSAGVVALGSEMSDAEKALLFRAYNENLVLVGVGAVSELSPAAPEYVDLGLPSGTLWGTKNLGATAPEEAGLYFQWGDTEGYTAAQVGTGAGKKKFDINFEDYKYADTSGQNPVMTKYNPTDGKTVLEAADDAAVAALATPWRMPTTAQFEELFNDQYTTNEWVANYQGSGVAGRLVTSKTNGNSIFLPAAGCASDGSVSGVGSNGGYWSSSLNEEGEASAFSLYFRSGGVDPDYDDYRCSGYSVRPVQNASV